MEEYKKIDSGIESFETANRKEESSFDIKTIFTLIVLNWQWFLLSLIICLAAAMIYLRYKSPVYQVSAKMLIKEETNNRRASNQMLANMQDFGFISNSAGIENEVEILKSRRLAYDAIKDLKLYVEYSSKGTVKERLVYKYQPINVDLDAAHLAELDQTRSAFRFKITRENGKYHVESENRSFEGTFSTMPALMKTPYGNLTFTKNVAGRELLNKQSEIVTIYSPLAMAAGYARSLSVEPTSKLTSIAQLTINDLNRERAFDYLKQLATVYNRQANADKNEIAYKTEQFINERLEKINAELGSTESELEDYKRRHNLTQLRLDATQTMAQASQFQTQLSDATVQIQLLDYLREFVESNKNRYQIIPSNVGLIDPVSSSLITQYNTSVQERNRLLASASETSPQVLQLTNTLDNLQASIRQALTQARRSADIKRQGIQNQYDIYQQRISSTPEQERVLTQIGR